MKYKVKRNDWFMSKSDHYIRTLNLIPPKTHRLALWLFRASFAYERDIAWQAQAFEMEVIRQYRENK